MSQERALALIPQIRELTQKYLDQYGEDSEFKVINREMDQIEKLVRKKWPVPKRKVKKIWLGMVAARAFDGYADDLSAMISDLVGELQEPHAVTGYEFL